MSIWHRPNRISKPSLFQREESQGPSHFPPPTGRKKHPRSPERKACDVILQTSRQRNRPSLVVGGHGSVDVHELGYFALPMACIARARNTNPGASGGHWLSSLQNLLSRADIDHLANSPLGCAGKPVVSRLVGWPSYPRAALAMPTFPFGSARHSACRRRWAHPLPRRWPNRWCWWPS